MRSFSLLLLAFSLTCTGVLVAGCAGATTQEVLAEATSPVDETGDTTGPNDSKSDAGTGSSVDPTGTCAPEDEPNDDEESANKLAPARCGTLSNDDQKDFLTFRLKSTTTKLSITLTGKIRLRVSVKGGDTVELTPDETSDLPFVMDEDYFVEVTALNAGKGTVNWRVAIVETE